MCGRQEGLEVAEAFFGEGDYFRERRKWMGELRQEIVLAEGAEVFVLVLVWVSVFAAGDGGVGVHSLSFRDWLKPEGGDVVRERHSASKVFGESSRPG